MPTSVKIAILTVSDTRTAATDTSGQLLVERLESAGHQLVEKCILPDNKYQIRALLSRWIAEDAVDYVITTGGTGLTKRDITPEAVRPLFDKEIEGFGEVFRWVSFNMIKTSTIQSRALSGVANGTVIFCLPGSTGACKDGWDNIIVHQLNSEHQPCNLVQVLPLM